MTQLRLNHLMIINIYKEALDDMDLKSITNEFVQGNEHRLSVFGNFVLGNSACHYSCDLV